MNQQTAEIELVWFLRWSDGDACRMRASGGSFLEESDGGGGGSSKSYQPRDWMPESAAGSRSRLRRCWVAFQGLTLDEQAVLKRRFTPRGPNQPIVQGFGEYSLVGEHLPRVQRHAREGRITGREALRELVERSKSDALLQQCRTIVDAALVRYAEELDAVDRASAGMHQANRERMQAVREGRANP